LPRNRKDTTVDEEEATPEETKPCVVCKRAIPINAAKCPHCEAEQPIIGPDILKTAHD
jgi:hypothetical protein